MSDLGGFAAANDLIGKSDVEVREVIGEKLPKHNAALVVGLNEQISGAIEQISGRGQSD